MQLEKSFEATAAPLPEPIEQQTADVVSDPYFRAAQNSFEFFRYLMRPQLITGWWVKEVCAALQDFYEDLVAGKRSTLGGMDRRRS